MNRLSRRGFTLVEIMIVVAIIALLAAIAVPHLLKLRVNTNDEKALSYLNSISSALEKYASANDGKYPVAESLDALAAHSFSADLPDVKLTSPQFGHTILFAGSAKGYVIVANVVTNDVTGGTSYQISTGGICVTQDGASAYGDPIAP